MFVIGTVKHVRVDRGFCFIVVPGMTTRNAAKLL